MFGKLRCCLGRAAFQRNPNRSVERRSHVGVRCVCTRREMTCSFLGNSVRAQEIVGLQAER